MLSYESVKANARNAARAARRNGEKPLLAIHFRASNPFAFFREIPYLGNYVPEGWVRVKTIEPYFVDASGLDYNDAGGPALSLAEFAERVEQYRKADDGYGFGIIEAGQFQVYIAVYRHDPRDFTHTGALTREELNRVVPDSRKE